jgi:hypothetical protein
MNTDPTILTEKLYTLLPAEYRLQDSRNSGALRELVSVIAEQIAAVQEGIEQAYDDLFIETCASWVIPYIGDLIGAPLLHNRTQGSAGSRAAVADTLALRRRKGTLAALEQTARATTGFPAVAVEFFTRMALTQSLNHIRPENHFTTSVRDELALDRMRTPFNPAAHTFEARRIATGRGKYNIPNIGVFLYRIQSFALRGVEAAKVDNFRFVFNPLGIDTPLYNDPDTETQVTQFAGPANVPMPITRVALKRAFTDTYGSGAAIFLSVDGTDITSNVVVCNLEDLPDGSGNWAHSHTARCAIDPLLGRIALPTGQPAAQRVVVNYRYGFSDSIGGGSYERARQIEGAATHTLSAAAANVQARLTEVGSSGGILEFSDSRTYTLAAAAPNLTIAAGKKVVIRAANGQRPLLRVGGGSLEVRGEAGAILEIDGLVLAGGALKITGELKSLTLRHCTLVPGVERTRHNEPAQPAQPMLLIEPENAAVALESCISGAIEAANGCTVRLTRCILDATDEEREAYHGPGDTPGGALELENCTIIGRVHTREIPNATQVIFAARVPGGVTALPVRSERTQAGCVRFSRVPDGSRTPRRFHCTSEPARFTSTLFGASGYCQLSRACPDAVRTGAEDESEIGVFHDLFLPQRESDLRTSLNEYLRFGMEAGVFYGS